MSSGADTSRWIDYAGLTGSDCSAANFALPVGQHRAMEAAAGGTVLIGIEGAVNISVKGHTYCLDERDVLSLPAGLPYVLHNPSEQRPAFICMVRTQVRSECPLATGQQAVHLSHQTSLQQMTWSLPFANDWGSRRGSGPYVTPEGLRGHTVLLPLGQASPWHHAPRNLYFAGIDGTVEFEAAGQSTRLARMDLVFVKSGTPYRYVNASAMDAFFLSIGGVAPTGARGVYYPEDPGWPVRADAKVLHTHADAYASLRAINKPSSQAASKPPA